MFDIKIVGATLVDGTGRAPYSGDLAITGDRIVAVGDCPGEAKRVIDAQGAYVTPGFVDIHTHYDGQVSWDEELSPSSTLGVTTVVMGSCGVGFAPVQKGREQQLIELMEGVEDIPGSALAEGIPWGWESFGEYMDVIGKMPHAIDFLVQVPHDPLRMYVMGDRAVADEVATDEDIVKMRTALRAALEAGAAGFSTGRSDNHRTAKGAATPASEVDARELTGIAAAFQGLDHGVLQAVSDFDMMRGPELFDGEFDLLEKMVGASGGRPLSISTMQRDHAPDQWKQILARTDAAVAKGLDVWCQVGSRGIGVLVGLEATFHPFMGYPTYKAIAHLPLAERVAEMRKPEVRAKLLAEKTDKVAGDGTPIPVLVDFFLANIDMVAMRLYPLGPTPNYEPGLMQCLAAEAADKNVPILSRIYDRLLEDDGRALLYFPVYNYTAISLDNVREMLVHPRALPGLGDGGAHVGTVCDASMATYLLTHWARDRFAMGKEGIPLERVVQMQTHDTARFIGLHDRGTLEVGMRADVNVIDWQNLTLQTPKMQADLPAGGKRLFQRAKGYLATIVAGTIIAENGELNGARPGKLVRVGQAAAAVS
jgi:N-acyl-D-aspartate/D-glutamate deacylase